MAEEISLTHETDTNPNLSYRDLSWGNSKLFQFLVGPARVKFYVHAKLIENQSIVLHALVNDGMNESLEQCAEWPDISSATFRRFLQFMYTGDYQSPQFSERSYAEPEDFDDGWNPFSSYAAWEKFCYSFNLGLSETDQYVAFGPCTGKGELGAAFHAIFKVYCLAERYAIDDLKELSLRKMFQLLRTTPNNPDIVDLLQMIPRHRRSRLSDIAIGYAACCMQSLLEDERMIALLAEHPELSIEIKTKMASYDAEK